jgi:hypothetical protein
MRGCPAPFPLGRGSGLKGQVSVVPQCKSVGTRAAASQQTVSWRGPTALSCGPIITDEADERRPRMGGGNGGAARPDCQDRQLNQRGPLHWRRHFLVILLAGRLRETVDRDRFTQAGANVSGRATPC